MVTGIHNNPNSHHQLIGFHLINSQPLNNPNSDQVFFNLGTSQSTIQISYYPAETRTLE